MGTSEVFLASFFILGISIFLGIIYSRTHQTKETFAVSTTPDLTMSDITLQSCPAGTTGFVANGITRCCGGDVVNNRCSGNTICALSSSTDLPSCQKLLQDNLRMNAAKFCPPSLKRFYEAPEKPNRKKNEIPNRGCTSGDRTPDGKEPVEKSAKRCYVYPSPAENVENENSCYNLRIAETYKCPGTGKAAKIVNLGNGIILHSCSFVGSTTEEVKITENIIQNPTNSVSRAASRFARTNIGQRVAAQVQRTVTRTSTRTITKPVTCYSEISYNSMLLKNKSSISTLSTKDDLLNFCAVANQYYIQKSLNDQSFLQPLEVQKIRNTLTNLINQQEKTFA